MNRLSRENQADILEDMMERKSIRGLARTARGNSKTRRKGVSINTVLKLLEDGGDAAIKFLNERMRKLPCRFIEADEVYCIVRLNPRTCRQRKIRDPKVGPVWLWVAVDAHSKLIVGWRLGGRTDRDAAAFMKDLRARFEGRIQLTTDSLSSYPRAVGDAFDDIDYATVKKRSAEEERERQQAELDGRPYRAKRRWSEESEKEPPVVHFGAPDPAWITTNHIEALFTQLRKDLARLTRRGTTISKCIENLNRAIALYVFHHNFVKTHTALKGRTPAVAAGIDDEPWEWVQFIDLLDDHWKQRREAKRHDRPAAREEPQVDEPTNVPTPSGGDFCVFHARVLRTSKVHLATCKHLRTDPERAGKTGLGAKLYCSSLEEALETAEGLTPNYVTQCRVCLGEYNSKGYRDPR